MLKLPLSVEQIVPLYHGIGDYTATNKVKFILRKHVSQKCESTFLPFEMCDGNCHQRHERVTLSFFCTTLWVCNSQDFAHETYVIPSLALLYISLVKEQNEYEL